MRQHKIITIASACGLLLSACGATFDYENLRTEKISGAGFESALAREYRNLALFEADEMYDWRDASAYGRKAITAAAGRRVSPDHLAGRDLPRSQIGVLTVARAELQQHLNSDAILRLPTVAARAQASFDCWLEQQEERWQLADISHCRNVFRAALGALEDKIELGQNPLSLPLLVPVREQGSSLQQPREADAVTLFFDFDSAVLDADGIEAVRRIARKVGPSRRVSVFVGGHSDRAGPVPYNTRLSARRVAAVRQALLSIGVSADLIHSRAFGEQRPRVSTPDGVREPRNRRVEIIVGGGSAL